METVIETRDSRDCGFDHLAAYLRFVDFHRLLIMTEEFLRFLLREITKHKLLDNERERGLHAPRERKAQLTAIVVHFNRLKIFYVFN
jgi:hypothetical protein